MLEYLIDEGICLNKEGNISAENIYRINNLDIEQSKDQDFSFLVKVAKSGCIEKCTLIMDYMADSRSIHCKNKYVSYEKTMKQQKIGHKRTELTAQQKEFLDMLEELKSVSKVFEEH